MVELVFLDPEEMMQNLSDFMCAYPGETVCQQSETSWTVSNSFGKPLQRWVGPLKPLSAY